MLTRYELVNVPAGGVDHLVDGRRWSITDRLTDAEAEFLINAGLTKYFRPKPQDNANQESQASGTDAGQPKPTRTFTPRNREANGRFVKSPAKPV